MKDSEKLTTRLREHADWCDDHEYEVPLCMGDYQRHAADLIEALQAQIAESRRRERVAVEDLKKAIKFYALGTCICGLCAKLGDGGCKEFCYGKDWQWRGPQEAGKGEAE